MLHLLAKNITEREKMLRLTFCNGFCGLLSSTWLVMLIVFELACNLNNKTA